MRLTTSGEIPLGILVALTVYVTDCPAEWLASSKMDPIPEETLPVVLPPPTVILETVLKNTI